MSLSVTNNEFFGDERKPLIRPASIFSFSSHILIIIIAVVGLPNLGRELPDKSELIIFDFVPIKEITNLDEIVEEKPIIEKEEVQKKSKPIFSKKQLPAVPEKNPVVKNFENPINKPIEKIVKEPVNKPIEKKVILPTKKPKVDKIEDIKINEVKKPIIISKPIMKPQILRKKNETLVENKPKTNPMALTSVLKTLEKITEVSKKKELDKEKKEEAASSLKDIVSKAQMNRKKNNFQEIGISYKDNLNQHLKQFWNPSIGAAEAENLIVDIFIELDSRGNVLSAKWINKGMNGYKQKYISAANAAIRAVIDGAPLPLPREKYDEWRKMTLVFDPSIMFGGY